MNVKARSGPLRSAYDDLLNRSLVRIPSQIGRLIYLASTRDYNSGSYHHEGLGARFSSEAASAALSEAHHQVFRKLATLSLEDLVRDLECYVQGLNDQRSDLLRTWQELEPYRVAIPLDADPIAVQLLLSNIKLGLEVLRIRQKDSLRPSNASPLPSPVR